MTQYMYTYKKYHDEEGTGQTSTSSMIESTLKYYKTSIGRLLVLSIDWPEKLWFGE